MRNAGLNRVIGGFAALAAGEIVNKLISAIVIVYLARQLGADTFGLVGFATVLAGYFVLGVDLGIDFVTIREVARRPELAGAYARRSLLIRVVASVAVTVAYLALVAALPDRSVDAKVVIALYALLFLPYALTPKGVLLGLERRPPWAIAQVAGQVAFGLIVLLWIATPADAWKVPVVQTVADSIQASAVLIALASLWKGGTRLAERWTGTLAQSLPLAWSQGMRIIGLNFDTLMIGLTVGNEAAGYYIAAYKVVLLFLVLGGLYGQNLLPAIARYYPAQVRELPPLVGQSFALVGFFAVPVAVGGSLLAEPIIGIVFGPDYSSSIAPFRILILSVVLTILSSGFRNILVGCNRQNTDVRLVSVAAVVNVALNLVIIPRFGLLGASLVTLTSEAVLFAGGWYLARALIGPFPLGRALFSPIVGSAALAAVLLVSPFFWLVNAVLAGLVYLLVVYATGGIRTALGQRHG